MLNIKNTSIAFEDLLGEGSFGTVYSATWESRKYCRDVAIKVIDKYTMTFSEVYEEAALLSKCDHRHIIKCFGVVENLIHRGTTCNGIVMEYMSLGDLRSYVEENEDWFRSTSNKWSLLKITYQIALAMEFLENIGIIHRDLAARNVLVEETNENDILVKVADFGLARYQSSYYVNYNRPIPFRWSAPEVIDIQKYTHESDVWAFGVTMWEIYSFGSMPYGDMSNAQVEVFISNGNRLDLPSIMPWTIRKILKNCHWYDPMDRITFEEIVMKFENYFDRRSVDIQSFYYS